LEDIVFLEEFTRK